MNIKTSWDVTLRYKDHDSFFMTVRDVTTALDAMGHAIGVAFRKGWTAAPMAVKVVEVR